MSELSLWVLSYDIRSRGLKGLDFKTKLWLVVHRLRVWFSLRFKYGCVPLQKPLWLVRKSENIEALENEIAYWEDEFRAKGFLVDMETFMVQDTRGDRETFKRLEMEFILQWLGNVDEKLDTAIKSQRISESSFALLKKRVELLESILREDFHREYAHFDRAYGMVMMAYDKLMQLRPRISHVTL
ncbi:MAG: hypothetical protein ACE5Z5_04230 [Candidatus Bathyarchaeia archaeon]